METILNSDRVSDQHFHSGTAAPLWDPYNADSQFGPWQISAVARGGAEGAFATPSFFPKK